MWPASPTSPLGPRWPAISALLSAYRRGRRRCRRRWRLSRPTRTGDEDWCEAAAASWGAAHILYRAVLLRACGGFAFVDVVVVVVTVKFRDLSPQTESESTKRHQVVLRLCHTASPEPGCQLSRCSTAHPLALWAWHCHSGGLLSMIASSLAKNEEPAAEGARTRGGLDHPRDHFY